MKTPIPIRFSVSKPWKSIALILKSFKLRTYSNKKKSSVYDYFNKCFLLEVGQELNLGIRN